ncbi:pentapeptide repeat-containing protein [Streptomyces africanus]|uniref:pentapeptide repeat-containing protein n=1 Tax=Streptomyces africanus TaxID=231024 RepID=UPI000A38AA7F|nr:pentapeptide repeat-containing protein [Streptomyces africanus]
MTKRTSEQLLRELLYLASPDSPEEGRAAAAEAIARHGDEALPDSEVDRLAQALRPGGPDEEGGEQRVRLRGADLAGGNLYQVRLPGADLRTANLSRTDLGFSDLRGADLGGAVLTGAGLTGADLTEAELTDADLGGAVLDDARLVMADLFRARLAAASLRQADLSDADLRRAVLTDADLSGATLRGTAIDATDLRNCDLTGTDLSTASGPLSLDDLAGARWSTGTRWPESQPGLGRAVRDNSVSIAPGVYRVGDDDSRDRATALAPSPRTPSPVR